MTPKSGLFQSSFFLQHFSHVTHSVQSLSATLSCASLPLWHPCWQILANAGFDSYPCSQQLCCTQPHAHFHLLSFGRPLLLLFSICCHLLVLGVCCFSFFLQLYWRSLPTVNLSDPFFFKKNKLLLMVDPNPTSDTASRRRQTRLAIGLPWKDWVVLTPTQSNQFELFGKLTRSLYYHHNPPVVY